MTNNLITRAILYGQLECIRSALDEAGDYSENIFGCSDSITECIYNFSNLLVNFNWDYNKSMIDNYNPNFDEYNQGLENIDLTVQVNKEEIT